MRGRQLLLPLRLLLLTADTAAAALLTAAAAAAAAAAATAATSVRSSMDDCPQPQWRLGWCAKEQAPCSPGCRFCMFRDQPVLDGGYGVSWEQLW